MRDFGHRGFQGARHEELNEVWTNLIHNTLQAMQHRGRLGLGIARDAERVRVKGIDPGPGISEEAQGGIFEPFYTTGAQGEGSGLGLSICRDIVARHPGTIAVERRPGRTAFTVALPSALARVPQEVA